MIFQKAGPGDRLFAIVSGRVGITTESESGKTILLNMMKAGEVLGGIALLDGRPRTANAVASEDSALSCVEGSDFMAFLERHPRLAKRLMVLGAQYGCKTDGGLLIDVRLSQESLGRMLGATRESINKGLKLLEHKGLIETSGGYIRVIDQDALESFGGRDGPV